MNSNLNKYWFVDYSRYTWTKGSWCDNYNSSLCSYLLSVLVSNKVKWKISEYDLIDDFGWLLGHWLGV